MTSAFYPPPPPPPGGGDDCRGFLGRTALLPTYPYKILLPQEYPFELSYSLNMLQLMRTLNTRARTSKLHGSIWQLSIAAAHLKEIAAGSAQDLERFKKWEAVKRCKPLDGIVVSRDAVKTAVSSLPQCKW